MEEGSFFQSSSQGNSSFPSGDSSSNGDAVNFECNICLELAQDPIVPMCGHLFCWPCLYKWLYGHSKCQECPVCKALVEEKKIVPLYGRGKVGSPDPRSKIILGVNIPNRPAAHRPETAPSPSPNPYQHQSFDFMGGAPTRMGTAPFGNFTFPAGFVLFSSLFGIEMQSFPEPERYAATPRFQFGLSNPFRHGHPRGFQQHHVTREQEKEVMPSKLLFLIGVFAIFCLIFF